MDVELKVYVGSIWEGNGERCGAASLDGSFGAEDLCQLLGSEVESLLVGQDVNVAVVGFFGCFGRYDRVEVKFVE